MPARVTHELLGVLLYLIAIVALTIILPLGCAESFASVHGGQFVFSNAAGQDFVLTGTRVEVPAPRRILAQWNRKNIVVGSDLKDLATRRDVAPPMHLVVRGDEIVQPGFVCVGVWAH